MKNTPPGLYPIRDLVVSCHLLVESGECVLIDTGLTPIVRVNSLRMIRALGLAPSSLKAIVLTHGHLDHTCNIAWIKQWSGAQVYANPAEQLHVAGKFPYQGVNLVCGWMEAIGRVLFRYHAVAIDKFFTDGDVLPFWGGLRVIHLPGHTAGHCGFLSERHDLLFSGDLFASYFFATHPPFPILNSYHEKLDSSFALVSDLNPRMIVPNHYDSCDPLLMRRRFQRLFEKCFAFA